VKGGYLKRPAPVLVAVLLTASSCTAPLYESAQIHDGFSWGGGVSGFLDRGEAGAFQDPADEYFLGTTGFVRWGEGESALPIALGLRSTVFFGLRQRGKGMRIAGYDLYCTAKMGLWTSGACVIDFGLPRLYSVSVLQDVGSFVTLKVGGCYLGDGCRELNCGLGFHPRLSENLRGHLSSCWSAYRYPRVSAGRATPQDTVNRGTSLSAGIGLEFLPGAK
jgi:hypothetical protein